MREIESIASALFDKIRSRFDNVTLGDEKAKAATDPEKARFFNFTYTDENGAEFGKVTLSLIDEKSLKIYFGQSISSDMDRDQRHAWYEFLRNIRHFAKRNNLSYDVRDINKDSLELQDIKQQAKSDDVYTANDVSVTESKLYGTSRNSYSDMGECRLVIKHDGLVNDEVRGDRARRIKDIFIETSRGERFLVPFKNLDGARALCTHLNEGGTMSDERADHICQLVKEMSSMKHFVRSTKHRQFEDAETTQMTKAAVHHYDQTRRTLRQMRGARGYKSYFETWRPEQVEETNIDVDALRERFVKKIYNDKFDAALPYVYRAYQKYKDSQPVMGEEFESWVNETALGENIEDDYKREDFKELMTHPLPAGIDGQDAWNELKAYFDDIDPGMENTLNELSSEFGPDADARQTVLTWMKSNGMGDLADEIYSDLTQVNQTPQSQPEQPAAPENDTVGATRMDEPVVNESDDLAFIRTLAGLNKKY